MPKSAESLIRQINRKDKLDPNEMQLIPFYDQVSDSLGETLPALAGMLQNLNMSASVSDDTRSRITEQVDALNTLNSELLENEPDRNKMQKALDTLGRLGDVLSEPRADGNGTVYDILAHQNPSGMSQSKVDSLLNDASRDLLLGINTSRLHDHQPMVHEVWEDEAFSGGWNLKTLSEYESFLPDNRNPLVAYNYLFGEDSADRLAGRLQTPDYGINGINTADRHNIHIAGLSTIDKTAARYKFKDSNTVQEGLEVQRALSRNFADEQKRRSDERTKRYYGDLAYISNPDNGNLMQAAFNTPYVTSLLNTHRTLVNPTVAGSAQEKMDLGVPLYNASYDLIHAAAEEVRVQYDRQRLEKQPGGWTMEKENRYLGELKAAHEQTIRHFDELSQFDEMSDGRLEYHYRNNKLNQTAATNLTEAKRFKNPVIGWLRGETQAIDNGWASNELPVLGMIGAVDENLNVYERLGNDQQKEEARAFREELSKLKNDCFYKKVISADEKKQIADRVKQFMEKPGRTDLQEEILKPVNDMKGAFTKAYGEISAAADKELHAAVNPEARKGADPVGYLKDLEEKAARSGNFSMYAAEVADVFAGRSKMPQAQQQELDNYWDTIRQKKNSDPEFVGKFASAMAANQVRSGAALERAKQEMSVSIREGREQVDPMLNDVKLIPDAARIIAGQKLENSEMARQLNNASGMKQRMKGLFGEGDPAQYDRIIKDAQKAYLNDRTTGLSRQERDLYLNQAEYNAAQQQKGLEAYGVKQTKDPVTGEYTVTQRPSKQQVKDELEKVSQFLRSNPNFREGEKNAADSYYKSVERIQNDTDRMLAYMEALQSDRPTGRYTERGKFVDVDTGRPLKREDANSGAFMNMLNALREVNELKVNNSSPLEVARALEKLDKAGEAYEKKIAAQGMFAAWTKKGQRRLELAGEVREFARREVKKAGLYENSAAMIDPSAKISDQYNKINNSIADLDNAIRAEQNQANAGHKVNQDQAGGRPKAAEQNQAKKDGIKEYKCFDDFRQKVEKKRPKLEKPEAKGRKRSSSVHKKQAKNGQQLDQQPMQPGNKP